jgi:serine/threonine-protein kinase
VLESEPTLPTQVNRRIPRALELICLRCLEKQPERRYPSAQALADDLHRYLTGEPVEARSARTGARLRRWARREPALASHWAALAVTALVVQGLYMIFGKDLPHHLRNMGTLATWAAISFILQRLVNTVRYEHFARFSWAVADTVLLTMLICLADGPRGPLLIGYPLLIAAAGLFFRVRLVTAMTSFTMIAYGVLIWMRPEEGKPIYYSIIFTAALAVVGFLVGYQTHRTRALSQYYEQGKTR